jgi:Flp pilus assembly protein TadG
MRTPFPPRRALVRDRRGSVMVQVGILLVALVGIGAIAVDFSNHYVASGELQNAADAAALAGAHRLQKSTIADPTSLVKDAAVAAGQANRVQGTAVTIRRDSVLLGWWEPPSGTSAGGFSTTVPSGKSWNAVRVRVDQPGQPLMGRVLSSVYNQPVPHIRTQATAWIANIVATNCVKPFALPYAALYKLAHGSAPATPTTPLTREDLASLNLKTDVQRYMTVVGPAVPVGTSHGNWFGFEYTGNAGVPGYQQGISTCDYGVIAVDGADGVTLPGNAGQTISRTTESMTTVFNSQGTSFQPFCSAYVSTSAACRNSAGVVGKDTKVAWGVPTGTGSNTVNFMAFSKVTVLCYYASSTQTCPATGVSGLPEGTFVVKVWEIVPGTVDPDDQLGNEKSLWERLMLVQ